MFCASDSGPRPKVSVIVPAFDAAWSLEETLTSVVAQTLADLEILIVDDGSTDDTLVIARRWAERDGRVRVVRQDNAGVAAARNRGLAEARGLYVAPIDSDDQWEPQNLERQVAALELAGPDALMAFAWSRCMDREGRPLPFHSPRRREPDFPQLLLRNLVANGSAAVMRRQAALDAGGYDQSLRARGMQGAEDWLLTLRMARRGRVVCVPEPLVRYRINPQGMSHVFDSMTRSALTVVDEARRLAPELPERWFRDSRSLVLIWMLPRMLHAGRYELAARAFATAYLANPGVVFRQPEPRVLGGRLLKAAWARLIGRRRAGRGVAPPSSDPAPEIDPEPKPALEAYRS